MYREGFVYLLRARKYYKIGKTSGPVEKRARLIAIGSPFKLVIEHTFPCSYPSAAESALHRKFKDKRMEGEWFRLSSDDVLWIRSIKSAVNDYFHHEVPNWDELVEGELGLSFLHENFCELLPVWGDL